MSGLLYPQTTTRLRLRVVEAADAARLLRYRQRNREHLAPWEPLRDAAYFTLQHCVQTLAESREAMRMDRAYPFFALDHAEQEIIASITFANVVRGAFQACHLGYSVDASGQGKGLMQEALSAALPLVWRELDLHRVMANYMPRNERSGRLLERMGFEREGYARRYLQIAGTWEDHVLTAKMRDAE